MSDEDVPWIAEYLRPYEQLVAEGPWTVASVQVTTGDVLTVVLNCVGAQAVEASIEFTGVRSFRMTQQASNWPLSLEVLDIAFRHWEDLALAVSDRANDAFEFYCESVIVTRH